jgi:hypothetical protein
MKITRKQLRYLIKEVVSSEDVEADLVKRHQTQNRGTDSEEIAAIKAMIKSNGAILRGIIDILNTIKAQSVVNDDSDNT